MKISEKSLGILSWALGSDECKLHNLIMDHCSISSKVLDGLGIFCHSDLIAPSVKKSNLAHLSLQNNHLDWEAGPLIADMLKKGSDPMDKIKGLSSLNLRGNRIKVCVCLYAH